MSFTEEFRGDAEAVWTAILDHPMVRELGAGALDDVVFRRYLVQAYAFVGALTAAFGYAVGQAPTADARASLVDFRGTLTDEEDDYFERSFDALGVPEGERVDPEWAAVTATFEDLFTRAALEGGYEETLAVLVPAEWVNLDWATSVPGTPDEFYLREWVDLHDDPAFESFVGWLRGELDRYGPELDGRRERRVARLFRRAVDLEAAFFGVAYE